MRWLFLLSIALTAAPTHALVLVKDGAAQADIRAGADAAGAAAVLQEYLEKISGARLEIRTEEAGAKKPAILVGEAAVKAGLRFPGPTPSREAYAILTKGNRLLMAGESPAATEFAVYHFLETLGCRWFMPGETGEVTPSLKTIDVAPLDIREKPGFDSRRIWGSGFSERSGWCRQNRTGGLAMDTRHNWNELVPEASYWADHPEYFSLIGGERKVRQLCTSNPEVIKAATQTVLARFRANPALTTISLSPNDGGGFCQCENCRKLDVAGYLEPSNGATCLSDRLQVFYNAVAREVRREFPDRILNYYAYGDYTLPPKRETRIEPNLMVWIAPIRSCRLHGMGASNCPSRQELARYIEDWSKIAPHIGYRTYNFNLAESITPYSKISIYKQEIPFLKAHNCSALNFETFGSWAIEGPHTYLSARLAWDAGANVDAIMAEFYDRLFGKAAPHVRYYWERVDRAFVEAATHAGSFYCLPRIWTPEMLRACTKDLEAAEKAAQSDIIRQRVRVFRRGLENARMYMDIHNASLEGDWVRAKDVYDRFLAHAREMVSDGILNPYGVTYLERFVAPGVLAGYARCTDGCSIVARLPDEWQFRYDAEDRGESEKWFSPDAPSDGWRTVRTYTSTIEEQGIEEQMTFMWYSTRVNVDKAGAGLVLWFSDVDGRSKVWVNGKPAGEGAPGNFDIDLKGLLKPGPNSITVRVDHSRISDLALGGILGPAFIYSRSQPQQQP